MHCQLLQQVARWQTWRLHSWPHWCKSKSSFSRANKSFLCCATMRKNYLHACSSRTSPMADLSALDVHMMHHRILHSKGTYMLLHKHPLHCQLHEENTNPAEYTNPADKKRTLTPRLGRPPPPRSTASQVQILSKHYGRTWGSCHGSCFAIPSLAYAKSTLQAPRQHLWRLCQPWMYT